MKRCFKLDPKKTQLFLNGPKTQRLYNMLNVLVENYFDGPKTQIPPTYTTIC